jgi:DNA-binding MarR family transcriptional regulator
MGEKNTSDRGKSRQGQTRRKTETEKLADEIVKMAAEAEKNVLARPTRRQTTKDQVRKLFSSVPAPLKVLPPVTEKQGKCLQFIWEYYRRNMYYPTQREVAEAMDVRSNTAEMYLQPLVQKGYLHREPRKQRNIRLTSDALKKLAMMGVNVEDQEHDR